MREDGGTGTRSRQNGDTGPGGPILPCMRADLLLVEDEPDLAEPLLFALRNDGHDVALVTDGASALDRLLGDNPPDLVLVDLMLPDMSGLEICRRIRSHPTLGRMPVMAVTARADEYDKVVGFEAGVDDYITKPFSLREVCLRVQALLRRTDGSAPSAGGEVRSGPLVLDTSGHVVTWNGVELELTVVEFRLLETFARHPGAALTRDQIRQLTWGDSYAISERAVDTNVRRLRQRLGDNGCFVETVRGVGYRWSPPEE
jgi:two-component system phosphate regulon response regulator PhoB